MNRSPFKSISKALMVGVAAAACAWNSNLHASEAVSVASVRVQLLSSNLVRLELKGAEGFEDRNTFHVVDRNWPGISFASNLVSGEVVISTPNYIVHVPKGATSLTGTYVASPSGQVLYRYDGVLANSVWLPSPSEKPTVLSFADTPRLIPPPGGLIPTQPGTPLASTSGWDTNNDAPDIYVFVPNGSYAQLRSDFLKLTGPTEMVPLYALGMFDSRWYDYSEATALAQIDDYRRRHFPLDVLVCDTGWRQGASTGYLPNSDLFPNLPRFFAEAHAKNVRVMFNDHPEPVSDNPLSPTEVNYRCTNLANLLGQGLDIWWYDRNWSVSLLTPSPNLRKEVWGMEICNDAARWTNGSLRPLIMANVDGIDNGYRNRPSDVAAHRFSIQWTGDIGPSYKYLTFAVENAVFAGVQSLFAYESDDLGGHTSDPSPNDYIRWLEYGALSPIFRPHCTHNLSRMPWAFGPEAEWVVRRYIDMRYRLLPVFYAAAHQNFETGEPILRRLDLDYPQFPEASQNNQYLITHSMLVAPVTHSDLVSVPAGWLSALTGEYFNNTNLTGTPVLTRSETTVELTGAPASVQPENFSARFQGTITIPVQTGDVTLGTVSDDGVRVWIDNQLCIDNWQPNDSVTTVSSLVLKAGSTHQLRIEYLQLGGGAVLSLKWKNGLMAQNAWIPPGNWIDAWTGRVLQGPVNDLALRPLDQIPIYIRSGSIFALAPKMQYTGQLPWDPITLDIYPSSSETAKTTLYEDDTLTTAYKTGQFRKTGITALANEADRTVSVVISPAVGNFQGALTQRAWTLRLRRPSNWSSDLSLVDAAVNGQSVGFIRKIRNASAMPFGAENGAPDADVFEIAVPSSSVVSTNVVVVKFASLSGTAWTGSDVGNVRANGNAAEGGTILSNSNWKISGSGGGIGGTADGFHFVRQPAVGNVQMTVCVQGQDSTNSKAKAGIMISEGLDSTSRGAVIALTPNNTRVFQYRPVAGGNSFTNTVAGPSGPCWLRLTRQGTILTGLASTNGVDWAQIGAASISGLNSNTYLGPVVTASQIYGTNSCVEDTNCNSALFSNVSLGGSVSISTPNNQTSMSGPTPLIPFTVNSANNNALTLSAQSSNPALLPVDKILFSGVGSNRFVTLVPTVGKSGIATVTLTVSDGSTSASTEFFLNVLPLDGLLLRESFTNYSGNMPGQPFRGVGFAENGKWAGLDSSFSGNITDAAQWSAPGLVLPGAAAIAGKVAVKGDGSNLKGVPDLSADGPFAAAGLLDAASGTIGGGNVSGTLYVSFLFRALSSSRVNEYGGLHLSRDTDATGFLFGNSGSAHAYSFYYAPTDLSIDLKNNNGTGSYLIMDNNVHWIVAKIVYAPGDDTVTVWMDPGINGEMSQSATYMGTAWGDCSFDRFFLRGGSNNQFEYDEIRFGTTWNSVMPSTTTPASPKIEGVSYNSDRITFSFNGTVAQNYSVLSTTNLGTPLANWTTVRTGSFGFDPVTIDSLTTDSPQRFYRVCVQ